MRHQLKNIFKINGLFFQTLVFLTIKKSYVIKRNESKLHYTLFMIIIQPLNSLPVNLFFIALPVKLVAERF